MHSEDQLSPPAHTASRTLLISIAICVGIIALSVGALFIWGNYLSPEAQSTHTMQKNYETYQVWEQQHNQDLTLDTYGGTTPEETLQLFVDALDDEDIELASKYFVLDQREQWAEGLKNIQREEKIDEIINTIKNAQASERDTGSENQKEFVVKNKNGEVDYAIILTLNNQSNIWKIESM